MTLYLKYRPRTLEELDLEEVRESLKKIVKSKNIPHALLFSGPKGLGKTSAARIVAKVVNCENPAKSGEPCNKCGHCKAITSGTHMDVIEIDAASHRGIDDIRVIREGVALAPAQGVKKVYIIDEAHMLTVEASNALLKTLEEPPQHAMFILATTNPEKLIETIKSRTTNIIFKKPTKEEVTRALLRVVKSEKIKLDDKHLNMVVEASGGSLRDAIKILETQDIAEDFGTSIDVDKFLVYLFDGNSREALSEISSAVGNGMSSEILTKRILGRLRSALLASQGLRGEPLDVSPNLIISLLKKLTETLSLSPYSPIEELPLEIAVCEWCQDNPREDTGLKDNSAPEIIMSTNNRDEADSQSLGNGKTVSGDLDTEVWGRILSKASPRNKSVEALLKAAKPISFDGTKLTLGVYYSFHKERLENPPHRQILDEIIKEVFGKSIRVVCMLTDPSQASVESVKSREGVVLTESTPDEPLTQHGSPDIIKLAKEMFGN